MSASVDKFLNIRYQVLTNKSYTSRMQIEYAEFSRIRALNFALSDAYQIMTLAPCEVTIRR